MTVTSKPRWIVPFDQGSRDMRELLGGKGANVAEMTRVLGAGARADRLHDHHRGVRAVHARRPHGARGARRGARRRAGRPGGAGRQAARRRRGSAARLRALGRARVDAGDDGHGPEPRAQRRVRRGPGAQDRQPALRLGRLPPLRADVRERLPRHPGRAARAGDRRRARSPPASPTTSSSPRTTCARSSTTSRASTATRPARTSRRTRRSSCARRSAPCSTRGSASAPRPTGGSTTSPTTGAPPATCSRWCSATRATRRARASRSRATR